MENTRTTTASAMASGTLPRTPADPCCRGQPAEPRGEAEHGQADDVGADGVVLPVPQRCRGDGDRPLGPEPDQEAVGGHLLQVPLALPGRPHGERLVLPAPRPSRHGRDHPRRVIVESRLPGGVGGRWETVGCERTGRAAAVPQRLRLPGGPPQRRQDDADQRAGRREGRHRQQPAADHPARHPRRRPPARRPARAGRHPGAAQAAEPAGPAAQRRRPRHPVRRRRRRASASRPTSPSAPATGSSPASCARCRRRSSSWSPRPTPRSRSRSPSSWSPRASWSRPPRWCRSARSAATRSSCWRTCWSACCPEGPPLYPEEQTTDDDVERQIAELIREAALEKVRQEVPHSLAVTVEEMIRQPDPSAPTPIWSRSTRCCTSSGPARSRCCSARGGETIKADRQRGPRRAGALLGGRVHLDLHVTVLGEWQDDPKKLNRLGY